jgi:hypothetical protein
VSWADLAEHNGVSLLPHDVQPKASPQTPAFQAWIVCLCERSSRLALVPDGVYIFKISFFPMKYLTSSISLLVAAYGIQSFSSEIRMQVQPGVLNWEVLTRCMCAQLQVPEFII